MVKYLLVDIVKRSVTISLDVDTPHARAAIAYFGDAALTDQIRNKLSVSGGAFGHTIGDVTSAIDLDFAITRDEFKEYSPQLTEGAELVKSYDPGIPEGAQT